MWTEGYPRIQDYVGVKHVDDGLSVGTTVLYKRGDRKQVDKVVLLFARGSTREPAW